MNVLNSNIYGMAQGGGQNSRLNLSNFLLDQRYNSIFGFGGGPSASNAGGLPRDAITDNSMGGVPNPSMLGLARIGSFPFTGSNGMDNLQSYKSGYYDMQELIHQLNMGPGGPQEHGEFSFENNIGRGGLS